MPGHEILGELGQGGMGVIYKARQLSLNRTVALKMIRADAQARTQKLARFLAEAQITGQLQHPGIVPVHDLGLDGEGRPFYIMTFIRGQTLKAAIEEYHSGSTASSEPAEVRFCRLLEVFLKVCHAVAYAHSHRVIHRDLKPDNVMLGEYGETLVLDWGMAKVCNQLEGAGSHLSVHRTCDSGSVETRVGTVMGSPAYMAPEMADGRGAEADERTDIYLLGASLYHILTGRLPRQGGSLAEVLELARTVSPPPPRKLKADIPRAVEAICRKAMAHRPQDRYASARELADDLQRYLAGAPVAAYREPLPARVWRWCKRHRRVLVRSVAGALVLGLALLAGAQGYQVRQRLKDARDEADQLQRCERVRRDLGEFHRLVEERQFYAAALTTPAGEIRLDYDPRRGEAAGQKALDLADRLIADLDQLPLPAEREVLSKELHDLLLLMVQAHSQQFPGPRAVQGMLERLERAASVREPSRGYHRLRARCYELLGDRRRAAAEEQRARQLSATALDHFLEAERYRAEAVSSWTLVKYPSNQLHLPALIAHGGRGAPRTQF